MKLEDVDLHAPMHQHMNQRIVSAAAGVSVIEGLPDARFYNPMNRVHGGFAVALIDTALGVAVYSKLPEGTQYGTIDLNVKYVRRIGVETGPVLATARVIHAGRTMLTAEARIEDGAGNLYAHGSGTFLVYPKQ